MCTCVYTCDTQVGKVNTLTYMYTFAHVCIHDVQAQGHGRISLSHGSVHFLRRSARPWTWPHREWPHAKCLQAPRHTVTVARSRSRSIYFHSSTPPLEYTTSKLGQRICQRTCSDTRRLRSAECEFHRHDVASGDSRLSRQVSMRSMRSMRGQTKVCYIQRRVLVSWKGNSESWLDDEPASNLEHIWPWPWPWPWHEVHILKSIHSHSKSPDILPYVWAMRDQRLAIIMRAHVFGPVTTHAWFFMRYSYYMYARESVESYYDIYVCTPRSLIFQDRTSWLRVLCLSIKKGNLATRSRSRSRSRGIYFGYI